VANAPVNGRPSGTRLITDPARRSFWLPKVATEMALNVLAYKRVMAIIGVAGLLQALAA
jgi:hypothetical protein